MSSELKVVLGMSLLLVRAAPVRPVGKMRVSPATGAEPPTQLFPSDQLSLGLEPVASVPDQVTVGGLTAVSTTSWPPVPPWYVTEKTWPDAAIMPFAPTLLKVPVIAWPLVLCRIVNVLPGAGLNEPVEMLSVAPARLMTPLAPAAPALSWS